MSRKKVTTPKIDRRTAARMEVTRSDALLLFKSINAEGVSEDAQINIIGHVDDVLNATPASDPVNDQELFLRFFLDGWQHSTRHTRTNVGEIIQRLKAKQSINEIHDHFQRERAKWSAKHQEEERNKPEPKDRTSGEWRYWKLRRMERALRGELGDAERRKARREFKQIARQAVNVATLDRYHAEMMLPHFIIAIQQKGDVR